MTPMTARLAGLLERATKGPWKAERHSIIDRTVAMSFLCRNPDVTLGSGNDADALLIAALLNAAPSLLTRIAALESALERLGSMEAFKGSRAVNAERDAELLARIDFARAALAHKETDDVG